MGTETAKPYKFSVSLSIWGDKMDPSFITRELQLEPTRFYIKGKPVVSPRGREFNPKTSLWELDLSKNSESNNLEEHIGSLVSKLVHLNEDVKSLAGVEGASINCFVGVVDENESLELGLPSEMMLSIGKLKIDLKVVVF